MAIPFLDLFKRAKARFSKSSSTPSPVVVARAPALEKPAGERLSKTVMPNTTRTVAPADPFEVAAGNKARRESSVSSSALAAPTERTISLTLSDVVEHLPQASLKPRENLDMQRSLTIKAAEVEKGMSTGQPTALLFSIYEQAPEIFKQRVSPDELTQVALPYAKVMQQFEALQVRPDQTEDQAVPQVETPFLQVTIEDTKRFGTSLAPLQTSAAPPVKVEPATARSIAKAEPEPVAEKKIDIKGRRPIAATTSKGVSLQPPPSELGTPPARIPFHLPPNGAGAPASERVPASSGPPVPTPPPHPPKTAAPVRIPFKLTPPSPELKPKLTLVPGVDPVESEPVAASPVESSKAEGATVQLRLNVCLRNVPAFQLSGTVPEIADDVTVALPCSVIEPQLASGRIAVDPKLFRGAIPEKFRDLFVVDATETPVLLPLQEVLERIPSVVLKMRHDQEHEDAIDHFETPFSKQAEEDRKRFGKPATEPAKTAEAGEAKVEKIEEKVGEVTESAAQDKAALPDADKTATPIEGQAPASPAAVEPTDSGVTGGTAEDKAAKSDGPGSPTPATTEQAGPTATAATEGPAATPPAAVEGEKKPADIEAKHNAKEFVLRASCLPGVAACSISFADGLTMADNFPPGLGAEGLCAVAPSLLQKIGKHMPESNLGTLTSMTMHCAKSPLSFFMDGNVCLTVLHTDQDLEPVTREQLADMTKELARIFAQPETIHVDH